MITLSEIMNSKPWAVTSIAGLQFYDYDEKDELVGQVRPQHGDRIQLVRRPDNRHDRNAVEVWWRDGRFQLGHIPRKEAAELAPLLDAGCNVIGHIWSGGNGMSWSAQVALVHDDIPQGWHVRSVDEEADSLDRWMDDRLNDEEPSRSVEDLLRAKCARRERRLDALLAFIPLMFPGSQRDPELPPEPPRRLRGKTLKWWDEIPDSVGLMTKTAWSDAGFNIKSRVRKPFCWIEYTTRRKHALYPLYASSQVTPKRRLSDLQLAKKLLGN